MKTLLVCAIVVFLLLCLGVGVYRAALMAAEALG